MRSRTTRSAGREAVPAVPPPAMTYPSAVGGRRKAVPLDRDSPKPLPDVPTWPRLDKAGRGRCRHDNFSQRFWRRPRASPVASRSYRATKAGLTPWGKLHAAKGPTYPSCLHPSRWCFLGSRQQPSPRCAVSGFAIENDPFSRQGGGSSRPTSSHDLPKCSGRQEKGGAAR